MATERVFVLQSFAPKSAPAGARHTCKQVVLSLQADKTFLLLQVHYYNDWGDKSEKSISYSGRYQETVKEIICKSRQEEHVDRFWDHDVQNGHNKVYCKEKQKIFIFKKKSEALLCPLRAFGFLQKPMRTDIKAYSGLSFPY